MWRPFASSSRSRQGLAGGARPWGGLRSTCWRSRWLWNAHPAPVVGAAQPGCRDCSRPQAHCVCTECSTALPVTTAHNRPPAPCPPPTPAERLQEDELGPVEQVGRSAHGSGVGWGVWEAGRLAQACGVRPPPTTPGAHAKPGSLPGTAPRPPAASCASAERWLPTSQTWTTTRPGLSCSTSERTRVAQRLFV